MSTAPDIPAPPTGDANLELLKLQYQAEIDAVTKQWRDAVEAEVAARQDDVEAQAKTLEFERAREDNTREVVRAREDADRAAESALVRSVHDAYLEVAKGSLDRSLKRAEYLVTVTTALTGVYTGLLALVYSVGTDDPNPLPPRGVIPLLFLGIGLILSAFYMAFLRRETITRALLPTGIGGTLPEERLKAFFEWTFTGVLGRAWALRMAVVSLGLGVALLPLPFLDIDPWGTAIYTIAAGAILAVWGVGEFLWRKKAPPYSGTPVVTPPAITQ